MTDLGKKPVVGIMVDVIDYEGALERIKIAATERQSMAVSALAVHGIMTGVQDAEQKYRLNSFDLIVPDGQPVRWALNLFYKARLRDRVYGPELTMRTLRMAEQEQLSVYFYGSTEKMLARLTGRVRTLFPKLMIAGQQPSRFRPVDAVEQRQIAEEIHAAGASIVFIGLGCPRQEVFAFEMRQLLPMPLIAVGAAFAFIAGELAQAPPRMQRYGLEWLFRLSREPRRLWRRYLYLNPYYGFLLLGQGLGMRFSTHGIKPSSSVGHA